MKRLLLLLSVFVAISTQAQTTWVVDSLNDSGFGSLRAAADSCSSGDTIRFNPNLIANGSDSIVLTSGEILFDDSLDVVIVGMYNSQDTLFFSGNKSSRIFKFWETGKVTLDSLVLRNGYTSVSHQYDGGAIFRWNSWDTMFIKNCIIYDNQASDDGGGIFCNGPMFNSYVVIKGSIIKGNKSPNGAGVYCISLPGYRYSRASVIVEKSIIKGNIGTGNGGGVYVGSCNSFVSIKDSEISNNSGNNGGGVYCLATNWQYNSLRSTVDIYSSSFSGNYANSGGGVYLESKNSRTNVYGSTFNNNVALGNGGGIYSKSNGGPSIISVSTSTFWENSSLNGTGGAMCENSFYGVFNIANSTIAMNSAVNGIGGVFGLSSSCNFNLSSSIFVENGVNTSGLSSFNNPVFVSSGYNIFSDSLNGMTPLDSFNVSLAQLNLQGLSFNGGITKTVLLGTGSIAIDNGNPLDSSDAQNAPIFGVRDIGAAEGCFAVPTTMVVSLCDSLSYSSPSGNSIYTQSGVYFDTLSAACGADSVFIIDLTLGFPNHYIDTIVACDSLTWIDGITYYSSNNTAKDTLVNVLGCDSIVYLDLTIINSSTYTDVIIACDSLTWINGVTYDSSNQTAKDTLLNAVGCDSIVSLDLTILKSSTFTDNITTCDSLTWINGVTYYSDTMDIYVTPNSLGCDSVITLNLTINHSASSTDSVIAVNQYTWMDGNTYFSSNNTATHLVQTIDGCDSLVTLNLHIEFVEIGVQAQWPNLVALATNSTFQWIECPDFDIIPGATDSVFTPTQNGSYALIVTQNGFTDTSDCVPVNNVGIAQVSLSNNINIYPNPVPDQVNIEITNWPTALANIVVRDISGKKVFTQKIEPISNQETIQINTTKWAKGTYFIEVGDGVNKVVEQIVVQ